MDDGKEIIKLVFGDSSDSEDERAGEKLKDSASSPASVDGYSVWESVNDIKGLWICRDFLSPSDQLSLLSSVLHEGWFVSPANNQAMRFGDLPCWATELSDSIRRVSLLGEYAEERMESGYSCRPLPFEIAWRQPLFDQMIVNVYLPGEGISPHIDLLRFEDGIAIVSLESSCVMHFSYAHCEPRQTVPVLLTPGSLILVSGEARYVWQHEINRKPGNQLWKGEELKQERRTSITLRKLCS